MFDKKRKWINQPCNCSNRTYISFRRDRLTSWAFERINNFNKFGKFVRLNMFATIKAMLSHNVLT